MEQGVMSDRTFLRYWMPTEFSESDWTNVQARIYEIIKHWFWASPDEMRKLVFGIGHGNDRKWYRVHVLQDNPFDVMENASGHQEIHLNTSGFGMRTEEEHTFIVRQQGDNKDEITTIHLESLDREFAVFAFTVLQMMERYYPGSVRVADNDLARADIEQSNEILRAVFGCPPTLDPEQPLSSPEPSSVQAEDLPDDMDFRS